MSSRTRYLAAAFDNVHSLYCFCAQRLLFAGDCLSQLSCIFVLGVTLRLAVYRQLVRLDAKLLEAQDQTFFFLQQSPSSHSPYITSSLMNRLRLRVYLNYLMLQR
jgi:hypothetical protein